MGFESRQLPPYAQMSPYEQPQHHHQQRESIGHYQQEHMRHAQQENTGHYPQQSMEYRQQESMGYHPHENIGYRQQQNAGHQQQEKMRHHPHENMRYHQQENMVSDRGSSSFQHHHQHQPHFISNPQISHRTPPMNHAVTPPASDMSSGTDALSTADAAAMLKQRYAPAMLAQTPPSASPHVSQLHHLSAVAAAQVRLHPDPDGHLRKRTIDGEVKEYRNGSLSPVKGHARTTSGVSVDSAAASTITSASTISDLSAELKTRLSYAMVKVNHGWQTRSLDEVETLASQGAFTSPTSSASTVRHGRKGSSSSSPRVPPNNASTSRTCFAGHQRRNSESHPGTFSNKPTLAPPATIQPSLPMSAPKSHPRRNSNPRYTPTMLSHSASPSAHSPSVSNKPPRACGPIDSIINSPHKNVREQDAIETLLFMSSPGNSTNLKHSLPESASPGPNSQPSNQQSHLHPPRARHALPSSASSRRALPSARPPAQPKKVVFDKSSTSMAPPPLASPMDLDSPPQHHHASNRAGATKRHATSGPGHRRCALSLPSGLGLGNGTARRVLSDEDIERMLDRAGEEMVESSDEEIELPERNRGVGGMG
ncbi:hypothetical protein E4U19_007198 [Claviceps sp. Clav32 group G5]|nr:hypothetical protein E4U40_003072 [Claviceps sp. LM458 group G5]KAG6032784.1 hypothetical protein E4U19_007198 [Claviceps sp. Clav32 group G5]